MECFTIKSKVVPAICFALTQLFCTNAFAIADSDGDGILDSSDENDLIVFDNGAVGSIWFTFWSEHLVLHNRYSLSALLREANFRNTVISGFQRYNLANHLHWLKEKKPGGHINWSMLASDQLDGAYSSMLEKNNMTDTIIAIAEK